MTSNQIKCFGVGRDGFGFADFVEAAGDFAKRHAPELVTLTAREYGGRDFVDFSGGEDKNGVWRRLFERFEQCIEGRCGEHVDFVDNIDFVSTLRRRKVDLIAQIAHIVYRCVGGGVDLDQVHEAVFVDGLTMRTLIAGTFGLIVSQAVDGLGKQTRSSGLTGATRAGK